MKTLQGFGKRWQGFQKTLQGSGENESPSSESEGVSQANEFAFLRNQPPNASRRRVFGGNLKCLVLSSELVSPGEDAADDFLDGDFLDVDVADGEFVQ